MGTAGTHSSDDWLTTAGPLDELDYFGFDFVAGVDAGNLWNALKGGFTKIVGQGVPLAASSFALARGEGSRVADPDYELVGISDFTNFQGRHVLYWLQQKGGGFPEIKYTVFEHQSDYSVPGCRDAQGEFTGFSPCDFWPPDSEHLNKFEDTLSSNADTRSHRTWQSFIYRRPNERPFAVRRIYRTVLNPQTGQTSRVLVPRRWNVQIDLVPGQEPLIEGNPAPYVGPN